MYRAAVTERSMYKYEVARLDLSEEESLEEQQVVSVDHLLILSLSNRK